MKKTPMLIVLSALILLFSSCTLFSKKPSIIINEGAFISKNEEKFFFDNVVIYQVILKLDEVIEESEFDSPLICRVTGKKYAMYMTIKSNYEIKETKCKFVSYDTYHSVDSYLVNIFIDWYDFVTSFDAVFDAMSWYGFNDNLARITIGMHGYLIKDGVEMKKSKGKDIKFPQNLCTTTNDLAKRIYGEDDPDVIENTNWIRRWKYEKKMNIMGVYCYYLSYIIILLLYW